MSTQHLANHAHAFDGDPPMPVLWRLRGARRLPSGRIMQAVALLGQTPAMIHK